MDTLIDSIKKLPAHRKFLWRTSTEIAELETIIEHMESYFEDIIHSKI